MRVTLKVGDADWGVWDTRTGGKLAGGGTTYRPGGTTKQLALGGPPTIDNVVLTRIYDADRDHAPLEGLLNSIGRRCQVSQRILDEDGNVFKQPLIWSGRLLSVEAPDYDSNSTDAALVTVEIAVDGNPTAV